MSFKIKATLLFLLIFILFLGFALYPTSAGKREYEKVTVTTFSKEFINVHLISKGDTHILIEAGLPKHKDDIEKFLADNQVSPENLSAIIVTHAHHDHAGTAAYFQKEYGIQIIGGKGDLEAFKSGKNGHLCPTSAIAKVRHEMDQAGVFPTFKPDVLIDDSLELRSFTDIDGQIVSVSSHTPGSLVIVLDEMAFVGDLIRGGIILKGTAAMHFYQCDLEAVKNSMQRILTALAPNAKTFFPSHLGPVSRESFESMLSELTP